MKTIRLSFIFLSLFVSNFALAAECGSPVTMEAVNKLPATATLGDISARFGESCQGEGPVSWHKGAKDKQIWFYWKNTGQTTTAGSKSNPVLMATEVNANDFDEQKIIWPKEHVGKEMSVILLNDYGPQKK
jgi:hypothetical protein